MGEQIAAPAPSFLPTKAIYCGDDLAAQLYRVLKSTDSFNYYCDTNANAYVRVMLDEAIVRQKRANGYCVAFDYTSDDLAEMERM